MAAQYMQYSQEWKDEMAKLPKETIIEIASHIGKTKQFEFDMLNNSFDILLSITKEMILYMKQNNNALDTLEFSNFIEFVESLEAKRKK